ncbi:unnamed protein product [Moneuplotes crassus]|uniref:Uncharacterized protein n=1 Tax=Euplotes crassus TaxID=5936 RepID=A0AAD2D4K0_EUPCR|nr:unnamed protein product [Moneuplotes crassus]
MDNQQNQEKTEVFSWLRGFKNGKWTQEEHSQFINCLKTHGINWPMLKKMVPTRKRLQIKRHMRRYLHLIKKNYGISNPSEYIKNNKCENLMFKKDKPTQNGKTIDQRREHPTSQGDKLLSSSVSKETGNSSSSFNSNNQDSFLLKKRDLKHLQKSLDELNSSGDDLSSIHSHTKVFSINKVKRAKQEIVKEPATVTSRAKLLNHKSQEVSKSKIILSLHKDEVIIKGAAIESAVGCDVSTTASGEIRISPHQNVLINIMPIKSEGWTDNQPNTSSQLPMTNVQEMNSVHMPMKKPTISQMQRTSILTQNQDYDILHRPLKLLSSYYCDCDPMIGLCRSFYIARTIIIFNTLHRTH